MSQPGTKVDYNHLDAASKAMKDISNVIDAKLDTLRNELKQMDWRGRGFEGYEEHERAWDEAVVAINQLLNQIGQQVGIAKESYLSNEIQIQRLWHKR